MSNPKLLPTNINMAILNLESQIRSTELADAEKIQVAQRLTDVIGTVLDNRLLYIKLKLKDGEKIQFSEPTRIETHVS